MNDKHETFERMCALTVSGQLTENDRTQLEEHALACAGCHERLAMMEQASYAYFLLFADQTKKAKLPKGMHERFIESALRSGISLRTTAPLSPALSFGGIAAAVVFMMLLFKGMHHSRTAYTVQPVDIVTNTIVADQDATSPQKTASVPTTIAKLQRRHRGPRHHEGNGVDARYVTSSPYMRQTTQFLLSPIFQARDEAVSFNVGSIMDNENHLRPLMKPLDPRSLPLLWKQKEPIPSSGRPFHFEPTYATLSFLAPTGRLYATHLLNFDNTRHLPNDNDW
jgi:hypothetical protein